MASWQRENGSFKGRGFGSVDGIPSLLNRIKTWFPKDAVSGGPGWFIIDDQSAAFPNPYIVVSDVAAPTNANKGKIVQFKLVLSSSDCIEIRYWMWWDVTAHTGTHNYAAYTVNTQENAENEYNLRGGPEGFILMTRIGSTWDYCYLDEWEGTSILLESAALEGTLQQTYTEVLNDGGNQVTEFWRLRNIGPHLDASGKLYVSVVVSGSNSQIFIYKDSSRTQLIGQTTNANTIGTVTVTAQNSSGITGSIRRNAITATDTDIEVDFTLHMGAGEGANFTVGEFYYIWDLNQATAQAAYFKVLGKVSSDNLIVDGLNNVQFRTGSVASPYGHRWMVNGNQNTGLENQTSSVRAQIPYMSNLASTPNGTVDSVMCLSDGVTLSGAAATQAGSDFMTNLIQRLGPDDKGRYAVQRPTVFELEPRQFGNVTTGGNYHNRAYGRAKNIYATSFVGLAQMNDGRIISGQEFICFLSTNPYAYLVRHSTSLS